LYAAGKKALSHGKQEYDSNKHLQHISAVQEDLKQWVAENPSVAGKINNAIETLRDEIKKMDQKRLENLREQKEEINQYLVKPMTVTETKAPNYRRLTDVL
jgi:cell shape-determining protein MreC